MSNIEDRFSTSNVTLTQTAGAGFLLVAPGDAAAATASTLNWSSDDQTVANASLTALDDDRNVSAFVVGRVRHTSSSMSRLHALTR